jgi:SAM-dependent methyltransferase
MPPRRRRQLNTIMEEPEAHKSSRSDSETDGSDSTITGRPAAWDPKQFVVGRRRKSRLGLVTAVSPVSAEASPCSSHGSGVVSNRGSVHSSQGGSENGTIFSDDTCPSLTSDPTTFATDSSRNSLASSRSSVVSTKSSRNRYPALLIPRDSWGLTDSPMKELALGMSPSTKITLSPAVLAKMPVPPAEAATPSLGSSSSVTSESPCIPSLSGPGTPDLRNIEVDEGEGWGEPRMAHTHNALEITLDDDHSILLSPAEAHSDTGPLSPGLASLLSPREAEWGGMVARFPGVPGVQAQAPSFSPGLMALNRAQQANENGMFLPNDALMTLHRLTRDVSPDEKSEVSRFKEMRERSEISTPSRPRSMEGATPATEASFSKLSDYSFTQLSIPSPGGFFSSLKGGARHTWCLDKGSRTNSVPTSAAAENFYFNWDNLHTKETVLTVDDTSNTEGPPTARQNSFDSAITGQEVHEGSDSETDDLYGAEQLPKPAVVPSPDTVQYEHAYEEELRQAAEAHLDRTSYWLSAQTSYLSALRESNPVNDPVDYLPSPHPGLQEDKLERSNTIDSNIRKTVRFLEEARSATALVPPPNILTATSPSKNTAVSSPKSGQTSPDSATSTKEAIFLTAFSDLVNSHKHRDHDTFISQTSRLTAIRSARIALPTKHIDSLLGQHWLEVPQRPKYSGPFNSNPRATGIFERNPQALMYEAVEREQAALRAVSASQWEVDALRSLYSGRLLASEVACQRLAQKSTVPLSDPACVGAKRLRVLDFGGVANGGWGWHAAHEWPNVKVYTIITKEQSAHQRPQGVPRPAAPENHRTVSVPHLWQLPFKSNHFDVVSARGLHALLRAEPVPGVKEIDEWELALRECMRVLKPGGHLDFLVMDAGLGRPGPRGEAISVEFGFELKKRGYEREAARRILPKLKQQGFVGVKRAWMFLPIGKKDENPDIEFLPAPRPVSEVSTISKIVKQYLNVEAVQGPVGSTQGVADITGLLGARMWEEWVLKVRMEAGREKSRLLEGIDEVLEEGKVNGSGWKCVMGWCRKPRVKKGERSRGSGRAEIKVLLSDDDATPMPTPMGNVFDVAKREEVVEEMKERPGHESLLSQRMSRAGEVGIVPFMIQGSP